MLACVLSGCATLSPERGHDEVGRVLAERTGIGTGWERGPPDEAAISQRVDALLASGLTRANAVAIALINNPALQATYQDLDISQADLVQAGLLKNPTLGGSMGIPITALGAAEFEFSLVQDIVDLITRGWRVDVATQQFKANTFRVAQQALAIVSEVNKAYVDFQAELELQALAQQAVDGAEGAHLLAEKQFAAGNISQLALARQRATYARLQLELTQAEVRVATEREQLIRLLGLWGQRSRLKLAAPLAELPANDPVPAQPEAVALRQRLDVAAARMEVDVLGQVLALAQSTRFFGRVEVGAHYHRDPDGPQLVGPNFSIELPLFDQRQAYIARLQAQQGSASRRVSALAIDTRSKVREGLLTHKAARATATYVSTSVVPLQEQVLEQSQLHYNGMLMGLYDLIAAQRQSLEARRSSILARRDYWIARFEVENTLGGSLELQGSAK